MTRFFMFFYYVSLVLLLIVGVWSGFYLFGFRLNVTPSVPMGLWYAKPVTRPLMRGDMVGFCPPDTLVFRHAKAKGYIHTGNCPGNYAHLLKPVVAVPGDTVVLEEEGVSVNGQLLHNTLMQTSDGHGHPMQSFPAGRYRVAPGTVWLVSNFHPRSYDSRYFGPVSISHIDVLSSPVWVDGRKVR